MYIGRDDSEPVRTRVSEFANVRVYSNAEDKTAFPWLSELNIRASRLNYLVERERERKRDDEDTRFAKNVDVVFITDAVEPAVELSALRVDFLLVEYNLLTSSFHFPSIQFTQTEIKISHQNAHEREPGDD
jgi:hypothetical protein